MLLRQGYHALGIAAVLEATKIPKGSFYHYFKSKEDFGLQAIELYMKEVHAGLDLCLGDENLAPLQRVRRFFELTEQKYRSEGYLGCFLGGLGQELSGVSEVFRRKVEECFAEIERRMEMQLFKRSVRGVEPTEAGALLIREAGGYVTLYTVSAAVCVLGSVLVTRIRSVP